MECTIFTRTFVDVHTIVASHAQEFTMSMSLTHDIPHRQVGSFLRWPCPGEGLCHCWKQAGIRREVLVS